MTEGSRKNRDMENTEEKAERNIVVESPGWWAVWPIGNITISAAALRGRGVDAHITAVSKCTGEKQIGTLRRLSVWELMHLNAKEGDEILLKASGPGAERALDLFMSAVDQEMQRIRDYRRSLSEGPEA